MEAMLFYQMMSSMVTVGAVMMANVKNCYDLLLQTDTVDKVVIICWCKSIRLVNKVSEYRCILLHLQVLRIFKCPEYLWSQWCRIQGLSLYHDSFALPLLLGPNGAGYKGSHCTLILSLFLSCLVPMVQDTRALTVP